MNIKPKNVVLGIQAPVKKQTAQTIATINSIKTTRII
ncbi:hypothetical protein CPT_CIP9_093 [Enterobacter phage vB_EclM_CIP9]|uniref:Uncharacterized protein n=1 Tax=Enterobacter phage vB_EclM_CIP9 TaxID=2696340 RepID=A0A6B9Y0L1_9CAUD|nr:hypothetical protein HWD05_gp093 [Enterobacter phage vB_EclM_CIP9]QHS01629.1 hypothetical protein CPT_CIP9_093 [Enterobacter phage vB_EclM_CIP9]